MGFLALREREKAGLRVQKEIIGLMLPSIAILKWELKSICSHVNSGMSTQNDVLLIRLFAI